MGQAGGLQTCTRVRSPSATGMSGAVNTSVLSAALMLGGGSLLYWGPEDRSHTMVDGKLDSKVNSLSKGTVDKGKNSKVDKTAPLNTHIDHEKPVWVWVGLVVIVLLVVWLVVYCGCRRCKGKKEAPTV